MTHKTKKNLHNVSKIPKSSNTIASKQGDANLSRDRDKPQCKWLEEYRDCFDGRFHPVTQMFLDRICAEVIEYAKTTQDMFRVRYFFANKNIPLDTVDSWREKYKEFATAYNLARTILTLRKENKFLNSMIVMGTMGRDDDEYDAWLTKQARLKVEIADELAKQQAVDSKVVVEIVEISRDK